MVSSPGCSRLLNRRTMLWFESFASMQDSCCQKIGSAAASIGPFALTAFKCCYEFSAKKGPQKELRFDTAMRSLG
jgi:hypothetical protein